MGIAPKVTQAFPLSGANGGQPSVTLIVITGSQWATPLSHSALGLQTVNPLILPSGTLEKSLRPFALDRRDH